MDKMNYHYSESAQRAATVTYDCAKLYGLTRALLQYASLLKTVVGAVPKGETEKS